MKSKKVVFLILFLLLGAFFFTRSRSRDCGKWTLTIGILQTASHPALDQARESFMAELAALSNGKISFVVQNAEGSLSQAHIIAQSFHTHMNIHAFFALGTLAAQAAVRAEKQKPIFLSAVTDPAVLGLSEKVSNVCGTTDQVDTEAQAELMSLFFPSARTVSILYNPSEHNSRVMVQRMRDSLKRRGMDSITLGVHSESEIAQTIACASRKGDLLAVPTDNLLGGAMASVAREACKRRRPLIISDTSLLSQGAFLALGVDYVDLGKQTAQLAHRVLFLGETAQKAGFLPPLDSKAALNEEVREDMKIPIPQELLERITVWQKKEMAHDE